MSTLEKIGMWVFFSPIIYVFAMSVNLHLVRLGVTDFTLPFLWKFIQLTKSNVGHNIGDKND